MAYPTIIRLAGPYIGVKLECHTGMKQVELRFSRIGANLNRVAQR